MPGTSSRSQPTRTAILDAARTLFRRDGFAATTVRAIAAEAHVDPALVVRYFGGKRALYDATTEIDLDLPDLTAVPRRRLGETIVREFLLRWDGERGEPLRILLTAATTDPHAAARLREIFGDQVQPVLEHLQLPDTPRRLQVVVATMLGLALTRYAIRFEPTASQSADEVAAAFGPAVQRLVSRA